MRRKPSVIAQLEVMSIHLSLYYVFVLFVEDSFEKKEKSLKLSEAEAKKKIKNLDMLAKVYIADDLFLFRMCCTHHWYYVIAGKRTEAQDESTRNGEDEREATVLR
jgi:hypothetical protein